MPNGGLNHRRQVTLALTTAPSDTSCSEMRARWSDPETMASLPTGVFVGLTPGDTNFWPPTRSIAGPYGFTGTNFFSLASRRIAYALGLHGPAATVTPRVLLHARRASGLQQPARRRKRPCFRRRRLPDPGRAEVRLRVGAGPAVSHGTLQCLRRRGRRLRGFRRLRRAVAQAATGWAPRRRPHVGCGALHRRQSGRPHRQPNTEMYSRICTTMSPSPNPPENGLPAYRTRRAQPDVHRALSAADP